MMSTDEFKDSVEAWMKHAAKRGRVKMAKRRREIEYTASVAFKHGHDVTMRVVIKEQWRTGPEIGLEYRDKKGKFLGGFIVRDAGIEREGNDLVIRSNRSTIVIGEWGPMATIE